MGKIKDCFNEREERGERTKTKGKQGVIEILAWADNRIEGVENSIGGGV